MITLKHAFIYILLSIVCLSCNQQGNKKHQSCADIRIQKIDSLMKSRHAEELFSGGIVINEKGKIEYEKYFGLADRSWEIQVASDTKFDIASVNKSMTAALIMKAVETDKLHLEDKLIDLLQEFDYSGEFHPEITIHSMLSHRSGLPDYDGISEDLRENNFLKFKRSRFTNEEYVDFISQLEPVNEPDKQFYYSNFAYHLLAIILEKTHEKPFSQVLYENLTKPLGLKNTVSESKNERIIERLANAYQYNDKENEWEETPIIDLSLGRRIFSTASDLNRWAMSMSNPGYLSEKSLETIKTNHLKNISESISYGYGWVVVDRENKSQMGDLGIEKPYIIHGGSTDGYKSMLININEGEYVISFLSNVGDRTDEMNLAIQIVNLLII